MNITIKKLEQRIKRCNKKGVRYDFLGFLENNDLDADVSSLFTYYNNSGQACGYDWVNGNDKLKEFIAGIL